MTYWLAAVMNVLIVLVGMSGIWVGTEGGSIWTSESARMLEVRSNPRPLKSYPVQNTLIGESNLAAHGSSVLVLDFIYTHCPDVCIAMGAEFRDIQESLDLIDPEFEVQLLSITFDPEHDSMDQLEHYLSAFGAKKERWSAARLVNQADLDSILQQLEIIVIPQEPHGFVHNAAFYLVVNNSVVAIYNINSTAQLVDEIEWQLQQLKSS